MASKRQRIERGIYESVLADGKTKRYDVALTDANSKLYWERATSLKEARSIRAARIHAKDQGQALVANDHTVRSLGGLFLESLEARAASGEIKPSTLASAKQNLKHHVYPTLGDKRLKNLAARDVHALIDALRKKELAPSTNRLAVDTLGRVLAFGKKRGLIAQNVCRELERGDRPSAARREPATPIEANDLRKLLASAYESWRLLFYVAAWTGLRQGEVLGVRWSDVDFEHSRINVAGQLGRDREWAATKTATGRRTIDVLAAPVMTELRKAYLAAEDKSAFVFVTEDGRPRHHHVCLEVFQTACRRAGIGERKFHDLRHTFASRLIASGFDPVYVAAQLGHSKPSLTLDTYSHLYAKHRRTEAAREQLGAEAQALLG